YVDAGDLGLAHLCDDHVEALAHIDRFYANYRSIRWFGPRLVIRVGVLPDRDQLADLNDRFSSMTTDGRGLRVVGPTPAETAEHDDVEAKRLALMLDPSRVAGLHRLIAALNELVPRSS
ncbi:MAG: Rossman fold protein, TIGR00730 family, partial [Actinobacteria bacterium]|nr:Rossman fold protein, TIGR00730 family [Actinomycetota bacterium]